ncbi:protein of unknown function [endosymbiont DhMRE of Dentiscutata heterogama]|uniref:hypothetical protein n=1 Tax=endosymbiont DhMRE of Dentiscutata heterogama TaxID=1609546 RepID=UPI000629DAF1|nr:hypothetical protein [endosymbiont DhMRE of Dentiscutata heterogama]CFW92972.1 protein of unknown function [endosymbiont DhMRE of Dentiscutata heterogama]
MNKELNNSETGLNQKFFKEVIENSQLSEESKKRLGDLEKGWKNDQPKEILKEEDKSKIQTYEELEVKDLPKDWRDQLTRLKYLEGLLADYEPKIEELKTWTDTFGEKKPLEVQEKFTNLEEEYNTFRQKSEEQIQELTKKCELAENKVKEWEQSFPNQTALTVQQENEELKKNLGEWIENWGGKELEEVRAEWEELEKRPDIAITSQQFWDDYVRREKIEQSKLKDEELQKEREKVKKLTEKNRKLFFAVNSYKKAIRTKKYTLMKPVKTIKQAREAIAELLQETENGWNYYLEGNDENITKATLELGLSTWEREKEKQVQQILEWIKEARVTLDYEKLLERWNNIIKENEENDFDGTPYLLKKLLEVKDFEAPPAINAKEEEAL